jgi:hypothetical protein
MGIIKELIMIDYEQLNHYLRTKQRIAEIINDPNSGFEPSRRHLSEGLAHSMTIADQEWTYSTQTGGYSFTHPEQRYHIFIANDAAKNSYLTTNEIVGFLRSFPPTEQINALVVDTWMTRAAMRGEVVPVPGGWRVRG